MEEATEAVVETAAPAAEAPAAEVEVETEAEAPSFPGEDDFGWDDWDGDVGTLPELVQPWGSRFARYHQDRAQAESQEVAQLRELYESLMAGEEDPRVGEMTTKLEELQAKFSELEASGKTTAQEYEDFKKAVEQSLEEEATAYAERYRAQHKDIFADEAKSAKLAELLEAGWELDYAPIALGLSPEALAVAQKALEDGVPMRYAIQLAQTQSPKPARRPPRPGAKITSGATRAPRTPNQAPKDALKEARSFDDLRMLAAQRAMKRR